MFDPRMYDSGFAGMWANLLFKEFLMILALIWWLRHFGRYYGELVRLRSNDIIAEEPYEIVMGVLTHVVPISKVVVHRGPKGGKYERVEVHYHPVFEYCYRGEYYSATGRTAVGVVFLCLAGLSSASLMSLKLQSIANTCHVAA